jgi:hypothetical protein
VRYAVDEHVVEPGFPCGVACVRISLSRVVDQRVFGTTGASDQQHDGRDQHERFYRELGRRASGLLSHLGLVETS